MKYLKIILKIESRKITKIIAKIANGAKIIQESFLKKIIMKVMPKSVTISLLDTFYIMNTAYMVLVEKIKFMKILKYISISKIMYFPICTNKFRKFISRNDSLSFLFFLAQISSLNLVTVRVVIKV